MDYRYYSRHCVYLYRGLLGLAYHDGYHRGHESRGVRNELGRRDSGYHSEVLRYRQGSSLWLSHVGLSTGVPIFLFRVGGQGLPRGVGGARCA